MFESVGEHMVHRAGYGAYNKTAYNMFTIMSQPIRFGLLFGFVSILCRVKVESVKVMKENAGKLLNGPTKLETSQTKWLLFVRV